MKLSDFIEGCERVSQFTDEVSIHCLISDLKKINESQKATVPEFIDDWIYKAKLVDDLSLCIALEYTTIKLYAKNSEEVLEWLENRENQETFARAWIYGWEVEKEKRYRAKIKTLNDYLNETETGLHFYNDYKNNKTFTRKELEKAGFGEVFNSPLFEVEEVENE